MGGDDVLAQLWSSKALYNRLTGLCLAMPLRQKPAVRSPRRHHPLKIDWQVPAAQPEHHPHSQEGRMGGLRPLQWQSGPEVGMDLDSVDGPIAGVPLTRRGWIKLEQA